MKARLKSLAMMAYGRFRALRREPVRFRGAFDSYEAALGNVRRDMPAGYDHDSVTDVSHDFMQQIALWDYPIVYWLRHLEPAVLIDAGGHVGVKYRAFRPFLDVDRIAWIVYDLPAQVRAGRARRQPQDRTLSFVDRIEEAPPADILLASGLLPYLREPFADLVRRLKERPRHILLNKIVTRDGPPVVTLENFGVAEVPYQIRNVREVPDTLESLGYDIVDSWVIDQLAHRIQTHPELGRCTYRGYVARRRD